MARGARFAVAGVVLGVAAALAPRPGSADPPEPTEREFVATLEKARGLVAAGDAAGARRLADQALARHARRDYARAKRGDVEDLLTRIAFRVTCPPPDPATLVQGTLVKYVSKTGEIELRATPGKHDLEKAQDGDLVFPARFCGPFTLTVRGASYPKTSDDSPSIHVGMEADPKTGREQTWVVMPGIPQYDAGSTYVWLPARLVHYDGDEKKVLYEKETSLAKPGQPWRLEVKVARTRIAATIDGKPLGGGQKPDTVYGFARFDVRDWSEIVVAGQVEPSWLQRKIDAVVDAKRASFEAAYDVRADAPAWLYEAAAAPTAPAEPADGVEPTEGAEPEGPTPDVELSEELRAHVTEFHERMERKEHREALEAAGRLRVEGGPEALASLLAARAHAALGETSKALESLDRSLAAAPGSPYALMMRASLLLEVGRDEEASAAWRAVATHPDSGPEILAAACLALLYAGRPDESQKVAEAAARAGHQSPLLSVIGRVLVQAARGPTWPRTFEHKSANYHVLSDIDVETCKRAAEILEESLTVYRIHVRALKAAPKRLYRVYLFAGEAGFLRYLGEVTALQGRKPEHAAGIYSPVLKQLLIWNLSSRDEMMRTVRHEGFHQYLDRLLPDPPVWLNEGMAVYFEGMEKVAGEMRIGAPRPDDLAVLREKGLVPLAEFLEIRPRAFYETSPRSYAQAWLLVHLLRHGAPRHRALYKDLLARLATSSGSEATAAVFPKASLEALDADLAAHLASGATGR